MVASTKTKEKPLTPRQKLLVDYLPEHNWQFSLAGLAAGYSKAYATTTLSTVVKRNVSLCKAIEEKRRSISAGTQDIREQRVKQVRDMMSVLPNNKVNEFVKLADLEASLCGWKVQTIKHESDQRQHELDEARREEIRRIATARYKTLPGYCGDTNNVVDAEVITTNNSDRADMSPRSDIRSDTKVHQQYPQSLSDLAVGPNPKTPNGSDGDSYPSME
jgi:glutamine synthetase